MHRFIGLALVASAVYAGNYTTYIGDANEYRVAALALDANGNTFLTGSRVFGLVTDVFVSKLDTAGNLTLLATFSGKRSDSGNAIALDAAGNIFIVGVTSSTNFPLHHPLQNTGSGGGSGFLVKLSQDGTVLYSTYLGGTAGHSAMNAVAVDSRGDVYVTGRTDAPDYPRTAGLPAGDVNSSAFFIAAAFFAKISSAGDKILYAGGLSTDQHACGAGSSCFLSGITTTGVSIAVDTAGSAYIAGNTYGSGLAGTPGALRTSGIGAFVAKVNAAGTALVYLSFLGSTNNIPGSVAIGSNPANLVSAITVDGAGNAYIAGGTNDPNFPVTASPFQSALSGGAANPLFGGPFDAFVAKLNPTGSAMVWATYLGGTSADFAQALAIDSIGDVWVSGTTSSADFPSSFQFPAGGEFLIEMNPSGAALSYSARFGVSFVAAALAVDANSSLHTAGSTGLVSSFGLGSLPGQTLNSATFGVVNAAGGSLSGRVVPGQLISIYGANLGPAVPVSGQVSAAGFFPTTLGGIQLMLNGVAAPLLYASSTQINLVTPVELLAGNTISLRFTRNNTVLPDFRILVDQFAPQVFRNTDGSAAALNQDGTINSKTNPAHAGTYVAVWATGLGYFPGADGQVPSAAQSFCACSISNGDLAGLTVAYAGVAPGLVNGVVQINFQIGTTYTMPVAAPFFLTINLSQSDAFTVFVTP